MTREEFDGEVDRHRRRFVGIATRILGDQNDAEDAVQDALLAAWLKITSGTIIRDFPAYVGKMTEFRARQTLWLRKTKKYAEVPLEEWTDEVDANSCSSDFTEDVIAQASERGEAQRAVLELADRSRLTSKQLTRFWQRYWYEMKDHEIAAYEGVSQQSVNTGIRSALLALQRAAKVARPP